MTTEITSNLSTDSNAASFTDGTDPLHLALDGYLISAASDTLVLGGTGQTYDLAIDGMISGRSDTGAAGIYLQDSSNSATITIGEFGTVRGDYGLYLEGAATMVNNGAIQGNSFDGLRCFANADYSITNNGLISSKTNYAIELDGSGTHTIINTGMITNGNPAAAVIADFGTGSAINLINLGVINGQVYLLSGGADTIHNEGGAGVINGLVSLFAGNDEFFGGRSGDTVQGGDDNDFIAGNGGEDVLNGDGGNDTLFGGSGDDQLTGGTGSDKYTVDSQGDTIVEAIGEGQDTVSADVSYVLDAAAEIELLQTTSSADKSAINLTGNGLSAQTIKGNAGNNILDGGDDNVAADALFGGKGNDTYVLRNDTLDTVTDSGGIDTMTSTINRSLSDFDNIENLILLGTAKNGSGDGHANIITGNIANNVLNGKEGSDILRGGGGHDTFVFDTKATSGNVDTIADFSHSDDTIKLDDAVFLGLGKGTLSMLDFKEIASAASTTGVDTSDRILYDKAHGDIYCDRDGSAGQYGRVLFASVTDKTGLDYTDFLVF